MREIGNDMKQLIKIMMAESNVKSITQLISDTNKVFESEEEKINESSFRTALRNNTLRVRDLQKVAQTMGYEIMFKRKDEEVSSNKYITTNISGNQAKDVEKDVEEGKNI